MLDNNSLDKEVDNLFILLNYQTCSNFANYQTCSKVNKNWWDLHKNTNIMIMERDKKEGRKHLHLLIYGISIYI